MTDRQWTPRVGAAWTPAQRWLLRGGVGTFADRLVLAAFEPALLLGGQHGFEQVVDGATASTLLHLTNGGALVSPFPGITPSIDTVQSGIWHPSSRQASVGVEHELTANLTASVNYLFVQGRQLPRTVNVNLPPPTVLTLANASTLGVVAPVPQQLGRPVFGPARLNPAFDGVFQLQPSASSTYHGVTAVLNRRLANELEWSAAYTWSHALALERGTEFFEADTVPQDVYHPRKDYGTANLDVTHVLSFSHIWNVPWFLNAGGVKGAALGGWH